MIDIDRIVQTLERMPRLRTFWRLGYGARGSLCGAGWHRVVWRVWWLDRRAERAWLECASLNCGVEPLKHESNAKLRARLTEAVRARPWGDPYG
jgi:hypothetical protein